MSIYSQKIFDRFFFTLAAIIPWGFALSVTAFYLHASILLGKFPSFANPDPGELGIYNFYNLLINPFFTAWILTIIIWIIAFIIFLNESSFRKYKRELVLIIIGHGLCFLISFSPILDWYLD